MPRAATIASGESRRSSGNLGITRNLITPRNTHSMQELLCLNRLEAGYQPRIGYYGEYDGVTQIALVACVGWREGPAVRRLLGGCGYSAVTNHNRGVEGICGGLCDKTPQNCMQCDCINRQESCALSQ